MASSVGALDAMPTELFNRVLDCMIDDVLEITNSSLLSGMFSTILIKATVTSLL